MKDKDEQFFHVRVKKKYAEEFTGPSSLSPHRNNHGFLFGGASAHLLVMNLDDEKRTFHSLQTLRDLHRLSTGSNANISWLISSGNSFHDDDDDDNDDDDDLF